MGLYCSIKDSQAALCMIFPENEYQQNNFLLLLQQFISNWFDLF